MKRFEDIYEDKTKLKEIPPIKKPAQAKVPTKREVIPGLGKEQKDADSKLKTIAEASLIKPKPIKDSEDAEMYIDGIEDCIDSALSYMNEPSFFKFCTTTDKNFDVNMFPAVQKLYASLKAAKKEVNDVRVQQEKAV